MTDKSGVLTKNVDNLLSVLHTDRTLVVMRVFGYLGGIFPEKCKTWSKVFVKSQDIENKNYSKLSISVIKYFFDIHIR